MTGGETKQRHQTPTTHHIMLKLTSASIAFSHFLGLKVAVCPALWMTELIILIIRRQCLDFYTGAKLYHVVTEITCPELLAGSEMT